MAPKKNKKERDLGLVYAHVIYTERGGFIVTHDVRTPNDIFKRERVLHIYTVRSIISCS
jgi:hypothetical protein